MHFGLKQFYFPFFIGSIVLSQPCSGYPSSQVRHLPRIFESHDPSKGDIKLVKGKRRDSRMKPSSYSWPKLIPTLPPIEFDQSLK